MTLTVKVKFNFKVKIYPILSLWVSPCDKSPLIEIRISQLGPNMHLSTFGLDWPWSSVSFLISNLCFSTKLCVSYSFASVCIYLVRPSPVNTPHSTGHHTYMDSYMHVDRVPPWTVKPSSFISWWTVGAQWAVDSAIGTGFSSSYWFSPIYTNLTWRNVIC